MIRKIIFWMHLCCGVACGLVVFSMSASGVLLMYERQIKEMAAEQHYVPEQEQQERLSVEQIIAKHQVTDADFHPVSVMITNDSGAPVVFRAGRFGGASLDPYSGAVLSTDSPKLNSFFQSIEFFHRWFNISGENRDIARQVTGISNVVFLFLVLSGMYLWLPKLYHWTLFRVRLAFKGSYPNSKTRDFHWHHIFGIWAALPLLAVVYTGAVISYPWAANLMYRAFGAEIPAAPAGPPPGFGGAGSAENTEPASEVANEAFLSLEELLMSAQHYSNDRWNRLTLTLPKPADEQLVVEIDQGNGAQAHLRQTLTLDRRTAAIVSSKGFSDQPLNSKLRLTARFLHTGEVLGIWGQTVAGLASFAALFLVYTGLALSWRRLIQPLFRKKQAGL